ncbi:MAG: hypothetical protein IJ273_00840, partial [Alphaproteobacteria bacterium]|nr:hypothetical protein [Alphaproteobacteria bacterium]
MNEYTAPSGWSKWFNNKYSQLGIGYSMSAFTELASAGSEIATGAINEMNYGVAAGNLRTQASQLELNAAENANILRKKYLAAVGNATYSAAARGADVNGGGTLAQTLERSSMDLGEDIHTIESNAARKAKSMNKQADIYEIMGKAYAKSAKYMGYAKLAQGLGSLG